jgi:hypothetical protein
MRKLLTGLLAAVTFFAVACLAPAVSQAAPCDGNGAEHPFVEWHDHAGYVLVSGGDFESAAAGWTLNGGVVVLPGGNILRPVSSTTSLNLFPGGVATSPPICVGKGDPVARIFMRMLTPGVRGPDSLGVEVLYLGANGAVRKVKKAAALHAGDEWTPSRRFSLAIGQVNHSENAPSTDNRPTGNPRPSRTREIELRFTSLASSVWQIDDVFVDPSARR